MTDYENFTNMIDHAGKDIKIVSIDQQCIEIMCNDQTVIEFCFDENGELNTID